MAALAHDRSVRTRPQRVASLLDQIEELRQQAYLAKANGVLPAGMRDLKHELRRLRKELAIAVSAGARQAP